MKALLTSIRGFLNIFENTRLRESIDHVRHEETCRSTCATGRGSDDQGFVRDSCASGATFDRSACEGTRLSVTSKAVIEPPGSFGSTLNVDTDQAGDRNIDSQRPIDCALLEEVESQAIETGSSFSGHSNRFQYVSPKDGSHCHESQSLEMPMPSNQGGASNTNRESKAPIARSAWQHQLFVPDSEDESDGPSSESTIERTTTSQEFAHGLSSSERTVITYKQILGPRRGQNALPGKSGMAESRRSKPSQYHKWSQEEQDILIRYCKAPGWTFRKVQLTFFPELHVDAVRRRYNHITHPGSKLEVTALTSLPTDTSNKRRSVPKPRKSRSRSWLPPDVTPSLNDAVPLSSNPEKMTARPKSYGPSSSSNSESNSASREDGRAMLGSSRIAPTSSREQASGSQSTSASDVRPTTRQSTLSSWTMSLSKPQTCHGNGKAPSQPYDRSRLAKSGIKIRRKTVITSSESENDTESDAESESDSEHGRGDQISTMRAMDPVETNFSSIQESVVVGQGDVIEASGDDHLTVFSVSNRKETKAVQSSLSIKHVKTVEEVADRTLPLSLSTKSTTSWSGLIANPSSSLPVAMGGRSSSSRPSKKAMSTPQIHTRPATSSGPSSVQHYASPCSAAADPSRKDIIDTEMETPCPRAPPRRRVFIASNAHLPFPPMLNKDEESTNGAGDDLVKLVARGRLDSSATLGPKMKYHGPSLLAWQALTPWVRVEWCQGRKKKGVIRNEAQRTTSRTGSERSTNYEQVGVMCADQASSEVTRTIEQVRPLVVQQVAQVESLASALPETRSLSTEGGCEVAEIESKSRAPAKNVTASQAPSIKTVSVPLIQKKLTDNNIARRAATTTSPEPKTEVFESVVKSLPSPPPSEASIAEPVTSIKSKDVCSNAKRSSQDQLSSTRYKSRAIEQDVCTAATTRGSSARRVPTWARRRIEASKREQARLSDEVERVAAAEASKAREQSMRRQAIWLPPWAQMSSPAANCAWVMPSDSEQISEEDSEVD